MRKTCFLFGHREASDELIPALEKAIEHHIIAYGITEFIVGSHGRFDHLAAKVLIAAKQKHPNIILTLLLPYLPAEHTSRMPKDFDGSLYPSGLETVPRRYAIPRANHYAVDHADHVIAYVWHTASNSRKLLEYAQRREARGELTITLVNSMEG